MSPCLSLLVEVGPADKLLEPWLQTVQGFTLKGDEHPLISLLKEYTQHPPQDRSEKVKVFHLLALFATWQNVQKLRESALQILLGHIERHDLHDPLTDPMDVTALVREGESPNEHFVTVTASEGALYHLPRLFVQRRAPGLVSGASKAVLQDMIAFIAASPDRELEESTPVDHVAALYAFAKSYE